MYLNLINSLISNACCYFMNLLIDLQLLIKRYENIEDNNIDIIIMSRLVFTFDQSFFLN